MSELNPDQFRGIAGHHILSELNNSFTPFFDKYEETFNENTGDRSTNSTVNTAKAFFDVSKTLRNAQDSHESNDPAGTWYHLNDLHDKLEAFGMHIAKEDFEGRVPVEKLGSLNREVLQSMGYVHNAQRAYSDLYRVNEPPKEG